MAKKFELITDFGVPSSEKIVGEMNLKKVLERLKKKVQKNPNLYPYSDIIIVDTQTDKEVTDKLFKKFKL